MIKFNSLDELNKLMSKVDNKGRMYILPLTSDGRLGYPIAYEKNIQKYAKLHECINTGHYFYPIEEKELPEEGWILLGDLYMIGQEVIGKGQYDIDKVLVGFDDTKPTSKILNKIVLTANKEAEFSVDDKILSDIVRIATEFRVKILLSWIDSKSRIGVIISEEEDIND